MKDCIPTLLEKVERETGIEPADIQLGKLQQNHQPMIPQWTTIQTSGLGGNIVPPAESAHTGVG